MGEPMIMIPLMTVAVEYDLYNIFIFRSLLTTNVAGEVEADDVAGKKAVGMVRGGFDVVVVTPTR